MRVAVIGGGGAGLVAAWLLEHSAEVTLFEAEDRLGGHMRTIRVDTEKGPVFAEMGFQAAIGGVIGTWDVTPLEIIGSEVIPAVASL